MRSHKINRLIMVLKHILIVLEILCLHLGLNKICLKGLTQ